MNFDDSIDTLRSESLAAAARCQSLETHPAIAQLALRLRLVQNAGTNGEPERPVIAALVGGTGAGKSHLFNALIGRPDASLTSGAERLKTKHPVVARRPAEHALLPDFGDAETLYVNAPAPWFALVDTPDLDGMLLDHREVAQRVIAAADLIVYVASPERVSDNAVLSTIREWAGRKRWFFVFNQTDRGGDTIEKIRAAFDERLREIGFAPDDACRFLVAATEPQRWDFERLRGTLFHERPRETVAVLAVDAVVGQILHACEPACLKQIETLESEVAAKERDIGERIIGRVREGIGRRQMHERLLPLLRKRVWMAMPGRTPGLLALPVAIHARFSSIFSAFQLWRLATAGVSLWRVGLLATMLFQSLRGSMEVRGILAVLDDELAPGLDLMATEIRFFVEDRGLSVPAETPGVPMEEELQQIAGSIPIAGSPLARIVGLLANTGERGRVARELAPLLSAAIEARAEEAAARSVSWLTNLAHLLPIAALVHATFHVLRSWIAKEWLPATFYLHALAIFLLTLLPGYLVIYFSVARQLSKSGSLEAMLGAAEKFPPCGPAHALLLLHADLDAILSGLRRLRARALSVRAAINSEFGGAALGATTVNVVQVDAKR
jgi:hypothetical protein